MTGPTESEMEIELSRLRSLEQHDATSTLHLEVKKDFFLALKDFQRHVSNPEKNADGHARGGKYRYANLTAIWDTIRDPLTEHGLSVIQEAATEVRLDGSLWVTVTTTICHQSGYEYPNDLALPVSSSDEQGIGRAITYGRRYSLASLLGICAEDDDDGAANKLPDQRAQTQPKPKVAQPPISEPRMDYVQEVLGRDLSTKPLVTAQVGIVNEADIDKATRARCLAELRKQWVYLTTTEEMVDADHTSSGQAAGAVDQGGSGDDSQPSG